MTDANTAEAKRPRLIGVPGGGDASRSPEPSGGERTERSGRLFALVAVLLVLAVATLVVQARRVGKLSGEVAALELEVEAANRRLVAYEAQRELVRTSLESVLEQLATLQGVVSQDPLIAPEPAEAP